MTWGLLRETELSAALLGALAGGGLSWAGTWRMTNVQWERERKARRFDDLEQIAIASHNASGELALDLEGNLLDQGKVRHVLFATTLLVARARQDAPHLAEIADELMSLLQDDLATREWANVGGVTMGSVRASAAFAWALSGATIHWIRDPAKFESARPTTKSFLEKVAAAELARDPEGVAPAE